jgi:hypoxanthine phosphoribosyltransferase
MKIKKIILYKKLDKKICQEYSKFKFGDPKVIEKYTTKLAKVIKKYIFKNKNCIIHTTAKSPLNKYCKKNSLILSEKIAKKLKLPLLVGQYSYRYNRKTFYENNIKRKTHPITLPKNSKLKKYDLVLMIDDAIFTGNTLKTSAKALKNIAREIIFFSIINLKNQKYTEKEINNFCYQKEGLPFLAKLLKNKHYIPTTQFIRTIDELNKKERKKLIENLNKKQTKLVKKAFKIYTGKNF